MNSDGSEALSIIKQLQDRVSWTSFIEDMKASGFIEITSLTCLRLSFQGTDAHNNNGFAMIVNNAIQSGTMLDASHLHVCPYVVFRPYTENQLRTIIVTSQKYYIPVTFSGGKTGLSAAYANYGIIVNLEMLQSLEFDHESVASEKKSSFSIDERKGTLTTSQHVLVSDLIKYVPQMTQKRFIFPIQPSSALELPVTIGGMIASDASGTTSGKLGSSRDWIESMRIMTPKGDILVILPTDDLYNEILGGNGYYGVVLSAVFRLYAPESNLKCQVFWGDNIAAAFLAAQKIQDLKIFPLISEFVVSHQQLSGKFNELLAKSPKFTKVHWVMMIKGNMEELEQFESALSSSVTMDSINIDAAEFQDFLKERAALALKAVSKDTVGDIITFPGFEDVLTQPKDIPLVLQSINEILKNNEFREVPIGYGHLNFRKGRGTLLHVRLPVPVNYFYEDADLHQVQIVHAITDVIFMLKNTYNIKPKAEHSGGAFEIWMNSEVRDRLRDAIKSGDAFRNPHLDIIEELLKNMALTALKGNETKNSSKTKTRLDKLLFFKAFLLYLTHGK